MTTIIIQARMSSTRLPGKILKNLAGKPMLWHVVNRCRKAKNIDRVILATTTEPGDDAVEKFCRENGVDYYRGSLSDVLDRYYQAAKKYNLKEDDIVVRVTCDCPLIDPAVIDMCINEFRKNKYDYISNVVPGERTWPRGLDTEVVSFRALEMAHKDADDNYSREHVMPYIWGNKNGKFVVGPMIKAPAEYAKKYRLTVDYPEDFELMEKIYRKFYVPGTIIDTKEVIKFLGDNPELLRINDYREEEMSKRIIESLNK